MLEFPVSVSISDAGDYVARLIDLPDGPAGQGIDPYSALEDLKASADAALSSLHDDGQLPTPSPAEDQPVISFDETKEKTVRSALDSLAVGGKEQEVEMIGYSWTNHAVIRDN